MKWLKKIVVIITIVSLLSCLMALSSFATDPQVYQFADYAGAIAFDIYGAANNTSLAYDLQPGPALTEIINIWNESQVAVGGDPVSMTALGTALLAAGCIGVVYDATDAVYELVLTLDYDNFGEFWYDFNYGWDYILRTGAGLVRDSVSDLFYWPESNGIVDPIHIITSYGIFFGQPISTDSNWPTPVGADTSGFDVTIYSSNAYTYSYLYKSSDSYYVGFAADSNTPYNATVTFGHYSINRATSLDSITQLRHGASNYHPIDPSTSQVPVFNSLQEALNAVRQVIDDGIEYGNISIEPSEYIGDPLQNPLEITVPDPASPMPQNQPIWIQTNIPVPDNVPGLPENPEPGIYYPTPGIDQALPSIWSDVVQGFEVDPNPDIQPDPNPDPGDPDDPGNDPDISEVNLPFLPITLPSFNLGLKNIWYYVVEWVSTLRSWFSLMFTIWANLPYAIVIPVYATAVVVIVFGVYKRFFM